MREQPYEFRFRHWETHPAGLRDASRRAAANELELTGEWRIGCAAEADVLVKRAADDLADFLWQSLAIPMRRTAERGKRTVWLETGRESDGFAYRVAADAVVLCGASPRRVWQGALALEDAMKLAAAPVLECGEFTRTPRYRQRAVHSGCGQDDFPDAELNAVAHAGFDTIAVFVRDFETNSVGRCNFSDLIRRAKRYGLEVMFYSYLSSFKHPEEAGAEEFFDSIYGELFRRFPEAAGLYFFGESMEFPSKDPATTGQRWNRSVVDGIPDTRPSPGWYPCSDYPAYLAMVEKVVHRAAPHALLVFGTYNWGYAPLPLRKKFLAGLPSGFTLNATYDIFAAREREGLHTPVMDYTISVAEPGYYFTSETAAAHELGIPTAGNVNTAGASWDFGTVPYVPTPFRWFTRHRILAGARNAQGMTVHYATHHYGWWENPSIDFGKAFNWLETTPDDPVPLLRAIARRDYGAEAVAPILEAWRCWSDAMDDYVASNEDQYGPWRVGPAYPLIFQPNLTRTMQGKEIAFPASPHAVNGGGIVKTLYAPFENDMQSPGFLRYPVELRSLRRMLEKWETGLAAAARAAGSAPESRRPAAERLLALGTFIRNSIRTVMTMKEWWMLNIRLQGSADAAAALTVLDRIEALARAEMENARATIPVVERDSRLGWEPSMEYVCDRWHLEWKIRQVESALREIAVYRRMIQGRFD